MQKRAQEANVSDLEMLRTVAATFMGAKALVQGPKRGVRGSLQRTLNMGIELSRSSLSDERVLQLDE
jgi:hypothetical protein